MVTRTTEIDTTGFSPARLERMRVALRRYIESGALPGFVVTDLVVRGEAICSIPTSAQFVRLKQRLAFTACTRPPLCPGRLRADFVRRRSIEP